jgi:hypothetical protein
VLDRITLADEVKLSAASRQEATKSSRASQPQRKASAQVEEIKVYIFKKLLIKDAFNM